MNQDITGEDPIGQNTMRESQGEKGRTNVTKIISIVYFGKNKFYLL